MKTLNSTCFAIILSCKKNAEKIKAQNLDGFPFDYSYFIGNDRPLTESINKNIKIAKCKDNYESLIFKTYESIKWVDENIEYDYILKTDDDIVFDNHKIEKLYKKIHSNNIDYTGYFNEDPNSLYAYYSGYHFDKCEDPEINKKPVYCPSNNSYASGGAYFLSKLAVKKYLKQFPLEDKQLIFEDLLTGKILNNEPVLNISRGFNKEIREAFSWD